MIDIAKVSFVVVLKRRKRIEPGRLPV